MSTISEIEAAIEKLPPSAVDELARWLDAHRARRSELRSVDAWLERACGAATPGSTTDELLTVTRGEE